MTNTEIIAALNADAGREAVDISLDEDGDLLFVEGDLVWSRGRVATVQSIENNVDIERGEWFLDDEVDEQRRIPRRDEVLVKNPNLVAVREHYRRAIAGSYDVAEVRRIDIELDSSTRTSTVSWEASTSSDQTVEGSEEVG